MNESTSNVVELAGVGRSALDELLRRGAQEMLTAAITAEVSEYVEGRGHVVDEKGHRQVVRNGYLPKRRIQSPMGELEVEQPRVRDRRSVEDRERFSSRILPPYLRKTRSVEDLMPWLYLKGISTGDFEEALSSLLGPASAKGFSASTIQRSTRIWQSEYEKWARRPLDGKRYVYFWADGVYFNIRLGSVENRRQCILVLMGATESGDKELIAIRDGYREDSASWEELLLDARQRGLTTGAEIAVGDGALGFWKALSTVYPETKRQRCWVHKTANISNKLPKSVQPRSKDDLRQIYNAEGREQASEALENYLAKYRSKYPKAADCLEKDREELLAFFDFPAEHWHHLRTTNPIESVFATVKHRTKKTKGHGSRTACMAMVFKLAESAQKNWRRLSGSKLLADVIRGVNFKDGVRVDTIEHTDTNNHSAAQGTVA